MRPPHWSKGSRWLQVSLHCIWVSGGRKQLRISGAPGGRPPPGRGGRSQQVVACGEAELGMSGAALT